MRFAAVVAAWAAATVFLPARANEASSAGTPQLEWGLEYRLKIESLDAPNFHLRPQSESFTTVGHRAMVHGELRFDRLRAFAEFSGAADSGRKPAERSFDRSRLDLAQAFIELPVGGSSTLRLGRQQLDGAGNRLISTREAANLRLAFDMAHAQTTIGRMHLTAFYGRPVLNQRGTFDDRRNEAEEFMGAWLATRAGAAQDGSEFSMFLLARNRRIASYQEGTASDHRRTLGARLARTGNRWDHAFQGSVQLGHFGRDDIRAFGVAGDIGWHPQSRESTRIGASFGYASGDRARDDHLGTFDVIYPNLGYFTDAPVYFPGNTADIQPNVTFSVRGALRLRAGYDLIARLSRDDAVYGPPGAPLVRGDGEGPHFVAALGYVRAEWSGREHVSVSLSYVHGSTSRVIRDAGGRDFNYGALVAAFRF